MSEIDELRAEVAQLRDQVTQESGLRAAVDRDQSGLQAQLRAQNRLLQALSTTQSEHTSAIAALMGSIDLLGEEIRALREQQRELRTGQQHIVSLLTILIERGDSE